MYASFEQMIIIVRIELNQSMQQSSQDELSNRQIGANLPQSPQIGEAQFEQSEGQDKYQMQRVIDERYRNEIQSFHHQAYQIDQLNDLAAAVKEDVIRQHYGIIGIRKLLCVKNQQKHILNIQSAINAEVLPKIISLMSQADYPQLRLEAAQTLANVASGSLKQCQYIVERGIIPLFIQLFTTEAYIDGVLGIANIASHSQALKDHLMKIGVTKHLVRLIRHSSSNIEILCWALTSVCRGNSLSQLISTEQIVDITAALCQAIVQSGIENQRVLTHCYWSISFLSKTLQTIPSLLSSGIIPRLIKELQNENMQKNIPCIRILGSFSCGEENETQYLIKQGLLSTALKVLHFSKRILRKQICWVLSNLTAGGRDSIDFIIEQQALIKRLLYLFEHDCFTVRYQICFLFANMAFEGDKSSLLQFYQQTQIVNYYCKAINQAPDDYEAFIQPLWRVLQIGDHLMVEGQNILIMQLTDDSIQILQKVQYYKGFKAKATNKYYSIMKAIRESRTHMK